MVFSHCLPPTPTERCGCATGKPGYVPNSLGTRTTTETSRAPYSMHSRGLALFCTVSDVQDGLTTSSPSEKQGWRVFGGMMCPVQ